MERQYVSDNYTLIKELGKGTFGEVYLSKDKRNNYYASKVEKKNVNKLENEYKIYKRLHRNGKNGNLNHIPKVYDYIQTPDFNIMVMQLLGKTLDTLFSEHGKKFKINTVLKLGYEILNVIEILHRNGYIHRDIKPNNFMFGLNNDTLYIMDFGLSKRYISRSNKHITMRVDRSFVGTARYASNNIHIGIEPSRRDDLESIGYLLIYFLKGSLPWQGLKKKKNDDHLQLIGEHKLCTSLTKLCEGIPPCFKEYLLYVTQLKYDEDPDYDYLRTLFVETSNRMNIKMDYEWALC